MSRLINLHNKTNEISEVDLPFNPNNALLTIEDLQRFFIENGLGEISKDRNINIYRNAFVHRSYVLMKNTNFASGNGRCPPGCLPLQEQSYDRLEFLGDAIISMVVAKYLYERYPAEDEGFLSRLRVKIVNGYTLGTLGGRVGFAKFLIMSKQIEQLQGRENAIKILEDVFEGFVGAIYMDFNDSEGEHDLGYKMAENFIVNILEKYIDFSDLIQAKTNYKDTLVMYARNHQDIYTFYEKSIEQTTSGGKIYTICVRDKSGRILGIGNGPNKKLGENAAAEAALKYLGISIDQVVMR